MKYFSKRVDEKTVRWLQEPRPWLKWAMLLPYLIFACAIFLCATWHSMIGSFLAQIGMIATLLLLYASKYQNRGDPVAEGKRILDERQMMIMYRAYKRAFIAEGLLIIGFLFVFTPLLSDLIASKMWHPATAKDWQAVAYAIMFGSVILPQLFAEWMDNAPHMEDEE